MPDDHALDRTWLSEELLTRPGGLTATVRGGQVPTGSVRVSGAKNSATRLIAAALLTDEPVVLGNAPTELVDLNHKLRFLRGMGAVAERDSERETVTIDASGMETSPFTEEQDYPIRTTYLLVAGQLRKTGFARIPYPGGCKIGSRGYDLHVMVWRALGCEVEEKPDAIEVRGNGFKAGRIAFPISTVGGTENALICASVANGTTEIVNAYITPEIEDLIELLTRMGARIEVFGNSLVKVEGVPELSGARMDVMPDRIEAITWVVVALMLGGTIQIDNVPFSEMEVPLLHIEKMGVDLFRNSNSLWVHPGCITGRAVQPFELACGTHPGIISDMQSFYTLMGLIADGTSRIFDYRYPERIAYARELTKLTGIDAIEAEPGRIVTHGRAPMKAAELTSTDLRGSMSLLIGALAAEGTSTIGAFQMALRGYDGLPRKLAKLGVEIDIRETAD
ncbi:UDP-N-acetylglucosamine 1-carboxyvinyltransferase [Pontivivens ytuae]|uniref:UDP-N-acetylglucosamine 1-carboxyvinyltransferase n=1 Tax=Pontivivens ytuae TaxID=2789856 RepID=UPI001E2FDC7B|nr:UDP-N-acetylglucosamine 1-carboxyvinyltransferase [Pontivivens ytuae]